MRLFWSLALLVSLTPSAILAAPILELQHQAGLISLHAQDIPLKQLLVTLGARTGVTVAGDMDEKAAQQSINYQLGPLALPQLLAELKRIAPFNYLLLQRAGQAPRLWLLQTQTRPATPAPQIPAAAVPAAQQPIPLPLIPPPQQQ